MGGLEEAMYQSLTPYSVPGCDVLPPWEEAKAPFLGITNEELGLGWVEV